MKEQTKFDIMVGFAIILMILTHTMTQYYMAKTTTVSGATMNATLKYYEANPVAELILKLGNLKYIYSYIVVPALLCGLYWLVRRKGDILVTGNVAVVMFIITLLNALNDATVLLAKANGL